MKNITKIILPITLVLFLASLSFGQSAADKSWGSFYAKFSAAVKAKNRSVIKSMTSKEFSDGGGGDTLMEWTRNVLDERNYWGEFYRILKNGTKTYNRNSRIKIRVTKDDQFLFGYENGRWRFYGVMGD